MTISSKVSSATLNGNGVATAFPFNFVVWDDAQLAVYITGTDGTTAEVSNWTVARTEAGGVVTYPAVGGTVLPTGARITILRNMPLTQEVDLVTGVAFKPEVVETALDQIVASVQQIKEAVDRSVSIPVGSPVSPTDYLTLVEGHSAAAQAAQAAAEAASVAAAVAREAADADALLTQANAETASAGAAVITANLAAINAIPANLSVIQGAPAAAAAAGTAATTATTKAGEANASALAAAQSASEAAAAASGGALKVSADDTTLGYLEAKLLPGDGLAASTQNAGGAETRTLSVALAESSGLGFEAGLLRVQAGAGLAVSPSGLAADVGTTEGKLVQVGPGGKLPAMSGENLTNLPLNSPLNGNFDVWLRGTSFADRTTLTNAAFYGPELWGFNRAQDVSGLSVSRVASGLTSAQYACKLQRAAGNTGTGHIAAYWTSGTEESLRFRGRTVTVGMWLKKGADYTGSNVTLALRAGYGTDQRAYAMTGSVVCGSLSVSPTSTMTHYEFEASIPNDATQIAFLAYSTAHTGTAGADDSLTIAELTFNKNSAPSPIMEASLCGKYYKTGTAKFTGQSTLTGAHKYWFTLPGLQMRVAPAMSATPSYTNASAFSWGSAGVDGAEAAFTVASAGGYASVVWAADAGI